MIYTSYFAKYKNRPLANAYSIARASYFWKGPIYDELVPPGNLVYRYKQGKISQEEYISEYNRQLSRLDAHKVANDLEGKILLCYERPGAFCHRHLVAEWLKNAGYEVAEIENMEDALTSIMEVLKNG